MIVLFDNWLLIKLNGMRFTVFLAGILMLQFATAQTTLKQQTVAFYAALNKGDSTAIKSFVHPNCRVKHVSEKGIWDLSLTEFLQVAPKFKSDYYSEEVMEITVHETATGFSYVDVEFEFYVEGNFTNRGIDHFCWVYDKEGNQKIESVYSSNYPKGYENSPKVENPEKTVDEQMNKWHNSAAVSDLNGYFNFMTEGFIYLGTDPGERWTKADFLTFCKPYFERESTWDFKTNWRNWYFSDNGGVAWFEESLATQMEECRGSGVLKKVNGEWKIAHYNLAVVIENEKMKKFIKLRKK